MHFGGNKSCKFAGGNLLHQWEFYGMFMFGFLGSAIKLLTACGWGKDPIHSSSVQLYCDTLFAMTMTMLDSSFSSHDLRSHRLHGPLLKGILVDQVLLSRTSLARDGKKTCCVTGVDVKVMLPFKCR